MARVRIVNNLREEVFKKFKNEPTKVFQYMKSLEQSPNKGKPIGNVAGMVIKELKYKSFRFYFIVDGQKLKVFSEEELKDLLMKFVRMSDKKDQQKVIEEIRRVLLRLGEGF